MVKQIGFTLIELLVVIAIIAILAAILFPVFAQVREKARQITCVSNEKQMGLAVLQYVQDYDEYLPPSESKDSLGNTYTWGYTVQSYVKNGAMGSGTQSNGTFGGTVRGGIWSCPSFPTAQNDNYGIHDQLCPPHWAGLPVNSVAAITKPGTLVLVVEKGQMPSSYVSPEFYSYQDGWSANGSFDYGSDNCALPRDNGGVTSFDWDDPTSASEPTAQDVAATQALGDGSDGGAWMGPGNNPRFRHQGMCSCLFVDGHVKAMRKGQLNWCDNVYDPGIASMAANIW